MTIKDILDSGHSLDYKDLSLCDLQHWSSGRQKCDRRFQIYSNHFKQIYSSQQEAIDKFLELLREAVKNKGVLESLTLDNLQFRRHYKENNTMILDLKGK